MGIICNSSCGLWFMNLWIGLFCYMWMHARAVLTFPSELHLANH